jgi:hypothetical protein
MSDACGAAGQCSVRYNSTLTATVDSVDTTAFPATGNASVNVTVIGSNLLAPLANYSHPETW